MSDHIKQDRIRNDREKIWVALFIEKIVEVVWECMEKTHRSIGKENRPN